MRLFLISIYLIIVTGNALAVSNFSYVGKEDHYNYAASDDIYPPLPAELRKKINQINFASLINQTIGNLYTSHGCIHLSPPTALILYTILPDKTSVVVKPYSDHPQNWAQLPILVDLVNNTQDLADLTKKLANPAQLEMVLYPRITGILFFQKKPLARFDVLSGPPIANYPLQEAGKEGLVFDKNFASPTAAGHYTIAKRTTHFFAPAYPYTSLLEQGTEIKKLGDEWRYWDEIKNNWEKIPDEIKEDINNPEEKFTLLYYSVKRDKQDKLYSVKWGDHPFGKQALLLMDDNNIITSYLIHTNGELLLEQEELCYYLSDMLSYDNIQWTDFVNSHATLKGMEIVNNFVQHPTSSAYQTNKSLAFYKLTNEIPLTKEEEKIIPDYYFLSRKVFQGESAGQYKYTQADKDLLAKWGVPYNDKISHRIIGIYEESLSYDVSIKKASQWYMGLKNYWSDLQPLRAELQKYFAQNKIDSQIEKKKIIYSLLHARINFKKVNSLDLWLDARN